LASRFRQGRALSNGGENRKLVNSERLSDWRRRVPLQSSRWRNCGVILSGRRSLCTTRPPDLASSCTSAHPLWELKNKGGITAYTHYAPSSFAMDDGAFFIVYYKQGVTTIMLDLTYIRNHPDIVKEAARVKNNPIDIDYLLEVDRQVLELQRRVEKARAEQNKATEPLLHELEETRQQLLYLLPNIPDPSAPIGKDENDNVPIRYWGEKPTFDFQPLNHYALMQKLDVVDIERAIKIAGARSYALKGDAARLELALMNFAMDRIARKGFTPLTVPAMAREFGFIGSGQFPKGRDQVYAIEDEDTLFTSSPTAACASRQQCAPIWEDRSTSGHLRMQGRAFYPAHSSVEQRLGRGP
jgi:Seryl-tRNA synthetase N-terminal domain